MREVEEWERTTKNMYQCGHRNGALLEFWPGDIIHLGRLIAGIVPDTTRNFEIFARVGDWRSYEDELLLINPDEAHLWMAEIGEIQQCIRGVGHLLPEPGARLLEEFYREELGSRIDLEGRLDKVAREIPLARVAALQHNLQQSRWPDLESVFETVDAALINAAGLCKTSIEIGNPIRLIW